MARRTRWSQVRVVRLPGLVDGEDERHEDDAVLRPLLRRIARRRSRGGAGGDGAGSRETAPARAAGILQPLLIISQAPACDVTAERYAASRPASKPRLVGGVCGRGSSRRQERGEADGRRDEEGVAEGIDLQAHDEVDEARVVQGDQAGLGVEAAEAARREQRDADQRAEQAHDGEQRGHGRALVLLALVQDRRVDRRDDEPEAEAGDEQRQRHREEGRVLAPARHADKAGAGAARDPAPRPAAKPSGGQHAAGDGAERPARSSGA